MLKNRADTAAYGEPTAGGLTNTTNAQKQFSMWNPGMRSGAITTSSNDPNYQKALTTQPWLVKQGGDPRMETAPSSAVISSRANRMIGPDGVYLQHLADRIDMPTARSALADVLSRQGQMSNKLTPTQWAKDYGAVSPTAKAMIQLTAPKAAPYLENAATGGRAFDIAPERLGLSKSMDWLAAFGDALSKPPEASLPPPEACRRPR